MSLSKRHPILLICYLRSLRFFSVSRRFRWNLPSSFCANDDCLFFFIYLFFFECRVTFTFIYVDDLALTSMCGWGRGGSRIVFRWLSAVDFAKTMYLLKVVHLHGTRKYVPLARFALCFACVRYEIWRYVFGLARRGLTIGFHLLWHSEELAMSTRLCLS